MKHFLFTLILLNVAFSQTFQLDEKAFFSNIQTSYYSLNSTDIQNFTALTTNSSIEDFAQEEWKNKEIFPIQFIWVTPDRVFLSQQGVPPLEGSKTAKFDTLVNDLKQQVTAILLDLQRFYLTGIYSSISEDYILVKKKQVVQIIFETGSDSIRTASEYTFGMNGLCLKIETTYPPLNQRIITYPTFKIVKTKWLCTGWEVQIMQNNEIVSGFAVKLNNRLVNDTWVPAEIQLDVQKKEAPGTTFTDVIKLRNFLFNQSLQLMDKPNADR